MKLPGINYQTAVGVDVSGMPAQTARAWANAADNWATAIDGVVRNMEEVQTQEALIAANAEAMEAERIASRPIWDVQEMGEPPESLKIKTRDASGPQSRYRMYEFGGQYYDMRAKEIGDKYGKGLSTRARRAFNERFLSSVASQRNRVLENQYKQIQSHHSGVTAKALEMATQTVEWNDRYDVLDTANELINEQYRQGYIELDDVVEKQAKYRNIIMENAARRAISEAGDDINHLRNVEYLISAEPGLDQKAKDRFATLAERKINRIERRLMSEDKERREQNDADIRLRYLRQEIDADEALTQSRTSGTPQGQRNMQDLAFVRGDTATRYSDPDLRSDFEEMISIARIAENMDEALDVIDAALVQTGLEENPRLSPDDIRRFQDEVQELRLGSEIFKTEDYRTTEENIHIDIVGQSKQSRRPPANTSFLARYREAQDDLREWLLDNPRDSASQWWRRNKDNYSLENWWDRQIGLSGIPREYVEQYKDGRPHVKKSQAVLNDALKAGTVSDEEYEEYSRYLLQLKRSLDETTGR